ncbi:hypothetical protein LPZ50_01465 [Bordetella petrii]|nr:hypothetical protein [Bordetella petrii]MCD0501667.1 hypothetical protein [Bordetella petrii]
MLVMMTSACSSGSSSSPVGRLFNECTWYRSGCMYEGSYEEGEREYAEEEAQRLNRAQLQRLRSSGG